MLESCSNARRKLQREASQRITSEAQSKEPEPCEICLLSWLPRSSVIRSGYRTCKQTARISNSTSRKQTRSEPTESPNLAETSGSQIQAQTLRAFEAVDNANQTSVLHQMTANETLQNARSQRRSSTKQRAWTAQRNSSAKQCTKPGSLTLSASSSRKVSTLDRPRSTKSPRNR